MNWGGHESEEYGINFNTLLFFIGRLFFIINNWAYKRSDNPDLYEEELADLSEFDGSYVNKTYRERIECDFDGFVVGFTKVDTKGIIGTDWESGDYEYIKSHGYYFKTIKERPKVAVVYFKNNVKRYVLLDDLTYMED